MNKQQLVVLKKPLHKRQRSESSLSDEWATQTKDFKKICKEYHIKPKLDVCATKRNRKCIRYFNKKQNGLKQPWKYDSWCNPPQSKAQKFILKHVNEQKIYNRNRIMIIPAGSTVTKAGKKYLWNKRNPIMYPLLPTPLFLNPEHEGKLESARNRYVVVIWRSKK